MILSLIISSILLISTSFAYLQEQIFKETELKEDEILISVYQDTGSCLKCYTLPMGEIKKLSEHKKYGQRLKIVAFVHCNRKKEMKSFIDKYKWPYLTMLDKGSVKNTLGLSMHSAITVWTKKDGIILNILEADVVGSSVKIIKTLDEME